MAHMSSEQVESNLLPSLLSCPPASTPLSLRMEKALLQAIRRLALTCCSAGQSNRARQQSSAGAVGGEETGGKVLGCEGGAGPARDPARVLHATRSPARPRNSIITAGERDWGEKSRIRQRRPVRARGARSIPNTHTFSPGLGESPAPQVQ